MSRVESQGHASCNVLATATNPARHVPQFSAPLLMRSIIRKGLRTARLAARSLSSAIGCAVSQASPLGYALRNALSVAGTMLLSMLNGLPPFGT